MATSTVSADQVGAGTQRQRSGNNSRDGIKRPRNPYSAWQKDATVRRRRREGQV
jgi:hypothetical protein